MLLRRLAGFGRLFLLVFPAPAGAGDVAPEPETRVIECGAKPISIATWRSGRIEVVDENLRSRYASDDEVSPVARNPNGSLSYSDHHGGTVVIDAGGDRITTIPQLKLTIREGSGSTSCATKEFVFSDGAIINGRGMAGRWTRADQEARTWRREASPQGQPASNATQAAFRGGLELTDAFEGEYRFTDEDHHFRGVFRRDGYRKAEYLDAKSGEALLSIESFPDGREIERRALDAERLKALGLADRNLQHPAEWTFRRASGDTVALVEADAVDAHSVVRLQKNNENGFVRGAGDNKIGRYWSDGNKGRFWGDVTRIGPEGYYIVYDTEHRADTFQGDGGWTIELTTAEERLLPNGRMPEIETPQYTIRGSADGVITIIDGEDGRRYRSDASDQAGRVTIEANAGSSIGMGRSKSVIHPDSVAWSFIDRRNSKITIRPDGSRTVVLDGGKGPGYETDGGGRIIAQFTPNQGLALYRANHLATPEFMTAEYHYSLVADPDNKAAAYMLDEFYDNTGLWKETNDVNGKQEWQLTNGVDANGMFATGMLQADYITVNRQNNLVIRDGNVSTVKALDGTEREETTSFDVATGAQTSVIRVGLHDDMLKGKEAYRLTAQTALDGGRALREELVSAAGKFVRDRDGPWYELDAQGRSKPKSAWAGEIRIDESGALIKQSYVTETESTDSSLKRVKTQKDRDGRDVPLVESTIYIRTDGETEQVFGDGAAIRRDSSGSAVALTYPSGDRVALHYQGEGANKIIAGLTDTGDSWKYDAQHHNFFSDFGARAVWTERSDTAAGIDSTDGNFILSSSPKDAGNWREVMAKIDGAKSLARGDGTRADVDAAGNLTLFRTPAGGEYKLFHDVAGKLVRVDGPDGLVVVVKGYVAPPDHPLPAAGVQHATSIELKGWGEEKYVSFVDDAGWRINVWPLLAEEEINDAGRVVRTQFFGFSTIETENVLRPQEKPDGDRLVVAKDIEPMRGHGADRGMSYLTASGERSERFLDGSLRHTDKFGRIVETRNWAGRERVLYTYASDSDRDPRSAMAPSWEITAPAGPQPATWRRLGVSGAPSDAREVKSLRFDTSHNLQITFAGGDVAFQQFDTRTGFRAEISRNGVVSRFDDSGRLFDLTNAWGGRVILVYEGKDRVPSKIVAQGEEWDRQGKTSAGVADAYSWKKQADPLAHKDSNEIIRKPVFDAGGRYVFGDPLFDVVQDEKKQALAAGKPNAAPPSYPAEVEIAPSGGEPTELTRTAKTADGKTIVTRKIAASEGSFIDDRGVRFAAFWVDARTGHALMASPDWKLVRSIARDGSEWDTCFDDAYEVRSQVARDGLDRVWRVNDADSHITRIIRLDDEITAVMQGPTVATEQKPRDGERIRRYAASVPAGLGGDIRDIFVGSPVEVDEGGDQIWRGRIERRVTADGLVEIVRPDGSRTSRRSASGAASSSLVQGAASHVFAPGGDVREIRVHGDGEIEATFEDGKIWRKQTFADSIDVVDANGSPRRNPDGAPQTLRGKMRVARDGALAFLDAASQDVSIFRPEGKTISLRHLPDGGWSEDAAGGIFLTREALAERLGEEGVSMFDSDVAYDMRWAPYPYLTPSIELGMEQLLGRSLRPTAVDADGTRHWQFDGGVQVTQAPDGAVALTRGDGSRLSAGAGSTKQWRDLKPQLQALTAELDPTTNEGRPPQPEYDAAEAAQWLATLDPTRRINDESVAVAAEATEAKPYNSFTDRVRGMVFLRRAAYAGNPQAQARIAALYASGDLLIKDVARAEDWYSLGAERGDAAQQYALAVLLNDEGRRREAGSWAQKSAEQGDDAARVLMTRLEDAGVTWPGMKPSLSTGDDLTQARSWALGTLGPDKAKEGLALLQRAADQNNALAEWYLADLYANPEFDGWDDQKAIEWLKKGAADGSPDAQFRLGQRYQAGDGVPRNEFLARQWIVRAALNGNALAQQHFLFKTATPAQVAEAEDLNRRQRADSGDAQAQFEVGRTYLEQKQFALAKQWLEKAAAQGYEPAIAALKSLETQAAVAPAVPPPTAKPQSTAPPAAAPLSTAEAAAVESWLPKDLLAAATGGAAEAQFQIALIDLAHKDRDHAIAWLKKAASQGFPPAVAMLATLEKQHAAQ